MTDKEYMELALKEADKASEYGDIPVGALVVKDGVILGRGRNEREKNCDPAAHAEIQALRAAALETGSWNLEGATLYSTVEPCPMCAGALINSRIMRLVYGADEPNFGSAGSQINLLQFPGFNHSVRIVGGVLAEESTALLKEFFVKLRQCNKEDKEL